MEDIKVGEYIRTKNGIIDKVILDYKGKCNNLNCDRKHISCKNNYYNEEEIIKHSQNIIDLIELKDVLKIKDEENKIFYAGVETDVEFFNECIKLIKNKKVELLSIVTKEQFKKVSYEV